MVEEVKVQAENSVVSFALEVTTHGLEGAEKVGEIWSDRVFLRGGTV